MGWLSSNNVAVQPVLGRSPPIDNSGCGPKEAAIHTEHTLPHGICWTAGPIGPGRGQKARHIRGSSAKGHHENDNVRSGRDPEKKGGNDVPHGLCTSLDNPMVAVIHGVRPGSNDRAFMLRLSRDHLRNAMPTT